MTSHAAFLLSEQGPFAEKTPSYEHRPAQMEMAGAVESAIAKGQDLIVEAGTGTGKTYAYLVPACELDGRTIISTGTKNLQDQLYFKDLPQVFKVLNKKRKVAILKGRQNYLCHYRLETNLQSARFASQEAAEQLIKIHDWSKKTEDGDLSQFTAIPEDSPAIPYVTSTADNCLGVDCPYINECCVAKARKRALESDILVVNHHLLMADLSLKEDGFGELLPTAKAYIIDEAHQLPDVASIFFSRSLSSRQLNELARDSLLAYRTDAEDVRDLEERAHALEKAVADFRLCFGEDMPRQNWAALWQQQALQNAFLTLQQGLYELNEILKPLAVRSRELENLALRSETLTEVSQLFISQEDKQQVQWFEVYRKSFVLNSTPLDIAPAFNNATKPYQDASWVMTSATLAVAEDFSHFLKKLGLERAKTLVLSSPFDYAGQGLLYAPRYLKNPTTNEYTRSFIESVLPLLYAAKGRAFLLFTSYRALNQAAELLLPYSEFTMFIQGQSAKGHLLDQFRKTPNAVLLGTFSFWEGVDVAGKALSLVAIDKLPFSSPGDPVTNARIERLRGQGRDAFQEFQLPDAVIALKQGAGRLIRSGADKGVLMVADPRLVGRQYGSIFRHNLPTMLPTRNQAMVMDFLESL